MLKSLRKIFSKSYLKKDDLLEFQEVDLDEISVQNVNGNLYESIGTPSPDSKSPDYNTLTFKDNTYVANVINSPGAKVVFTEVVNDSGERELKPASDNPEEIYVSLGAIKLIESLELLYQTEEAFFVPFPWLRNSQYDAEDHFVPLKLDEWGKSGQDLIESDIEIESVLTGRNGRGPPRRILIQAEPGSGKTTLCTRFAYLWSLRNVPALSRFKVAILVRLRNVKDETLEDYIVKFCHRATLQRNSTATIQNILKDLGNELLLILDAFDETSDDVRQSVNDVLGFKKRSSCQSFLRGATILTTSRPLKELDKSRCFDRRIRIEGIKSENRDTFIDRYVRDQTKAQNLKDLLKQTTFADIISPLTLTILCFLQVKEAVTKFQTEWELIGTILTTWGERCVQNEGLSYKGWDTWVVYYKLGELYFKNRSVTAAFTEKQLLEIFQENDLKFLKGCGLLIKTLGFQHTRDDNEDTYEPVHKKFVEFLIANYLKWEWDNKYPTDAKLNFLVELLRPGIEEFGIKAYDIDSNGEIKITCPVMDGVIAVTTFQTTHVECEFLTSSFASSFYNDILKTESLIKVKSIIKLYSLDKKSSAIPPQFRPGINYLCPKNLTYEKGVNFTYNIYRQRRYDFDPDSLAIKDESVMAILFFEYAEHSSGSTRARDIIKVTHGKREIITMLERAIENSVAVSCTTLFYNSDFQLLQMFPTSHQLNTLETVGNFAILQDTLRRFTKHYLKCQEPLYAVPFELFDVRDFLTRFFKSVLSCSVTTEVVATWNYHGHVFHCIHDPQKRNTRAYHASPDLTRKPSVPVKMDDLVIKIASVAQVHCFREEFFRIQLSMSPDRIALLVNLMEQPVISRRTVTWQTLKLKLYTGV